MSTKRLFQVCLLLALVVTSFATTGSAHAWSACGGGYYVQPGDWLAKIARNCGVSLSDLRAANPWTYYNHYIYAGQWLAMPDSGGWSDPYPGSSSGFCGPLSGYYVVCRGDTLGSIARYYGTTWTYLQWRNGIPNANRIYPGQVIYPW
jgi:LysM repeat protein